ncbi:hypothetical protein TrVE_jg6925 [Triparma verrucosa]|uniref:TNFR-Cys domain-containing protein n=1 Tax=Triparma verrucosa TaxID=1606542 RepID=A0A9W7F541_9STRA|nr:hypothetical protein TrVE_jg6925 [Triparma verrucosa]
MKVFGVFLCFLLIGDVCSEICLPGQYCDSEWGWPMAFNNCEECYEGHWCPGEPNNGAAGKCWGSGNYEEGDYLSGAPPIPCTVGKFSTATSASSSSTCEDCPFSKISAEGSGVCSACELHVTMDFTGTSHCVTSQIELFDKISNRNLASMGYLYPEMGRSLMAKGDKLDLAVGKYQVGFETQVFTPAAAEEMMFALWQVYGRIECALDTWISGPLCVISGEGIRKIFFIQGTDPDGNGAALIFNSIHFFEGKAEGAGGGAMSVAATGGAVKANVVLELCKLSKNVCGTGSGGGIVVDGLGVSNAATLIMYGTTFTQNSGGAGAYGDLMAMGFSTAVTISDDCPEGYEGTATQGSAISAEGAVENKYSFIKGTCNKCTEGKYKFNNVCTSCPFGKYNPKERATDSSACLACPEGKTNFVSGSASESDCNQASTHTFNFMGCETGSDVLDLAEGSSLKASPLGGATCSAEGIVLDGDDDFVSIASPDDPWLFGGPTTFEIYVKTPITVTKNSAIFDFEGDQIPTKEVLSLGTNNVDSQMQVTVIKPWLAGGETTMNHYSWAGGAWNHVVFSLEGKRWTIYNEEVKHTEELPFPDHDGTVEPGVLEHPQVWLGRNSLIKSALNFTGTIAFLKVYHNKVLTQEEVNNLPTIPCVAGTYGLGYPNCLPCPHGTYSTSSGALVCTECPSDKTSFVTGATSFRSCIAGKHSFDFRNCQDDKPVLDSTADSNLVATARGGASCSPEGMNFNGVDGWIELDSWEWGGPTSIEMYVRYDVPAASSTVLDFRENLGSDSAKFFLGSSNGWIDFVCQNDLGIEIRATDSRGWSASWVHIVLTVANGKQTIYKNGAVASVESLSVAELPIVQRAQNWIGRSSPEDGETTPEYFSGAIASLKFWHNSVLTLEEVGALPKLPCAVGTSGVAMPDCTVCPAGSYNSVAGSVGGGGSVCISCPLGTYNDDEGTKATLHDDVGDCKVCEAGKFNSDDGTDYTLHGAGSCEVCAMGKYNDEDGLVADLHAGCTDCPVGKYNEFPAELEQYHNSPDDCEICDSGTYNDFQGATTCKNCEGGKSSAPGASACGSCPAGYYCDDALGGGAPQPCSAGSYTDGTHSSCQTCTKGYRCPGGMNQQICPPGSHQDLTGQYHCKECAEGTFSRLAGSEECSICPEGFFCPKNSASPIQCGTVGLYCPEGSSTVSPAASGHYTTPENGGATMRTGQAACEMGHACVAGVKTVCQGGSYGDEVGAFGCKSAPPGYRPSDDHTGVVLCAAGKFSGGGLAYCQDCAEGTFSGQGALTCSAKSICPPGHKVVVQSTVVSDTVCGLCEAGTASMGGSASSCVKCDGEGEYTDVEGRFTCMVAAAGHKPTSDRTAVEKCPAGRYSVGGTTECAQCEDGKTSQEGAVGCDICLACEPGKHMHLLCTPTAGTVCVDCGKGTASTLAGQGSCSFCDGNGQYADEEGLAACKTAPAGYKPNVYRNGIEKCAAGKFSVGGATECTVCEKGKFSAEGAFGCGPCPQYETYNNTLNMCVCLESFERVDGSCTCKAGETLMGTSCEPCEKAKWKQEIGVKSCERCELTLENSITLLDGATSADSCICPKGMWDNQKGGCEPVKEGMDEDEEGMTLAFLSVMEGYWRTGVNSTDVRECLVEEACEGGNGTDYCREGHEGPYCNLCKDGWTKDPFMLCKSCKFSLESNFKQIVSAAQILNLNFFEFVAIGCWSSGFNYYYVVFGMTAPVLLIVVVMVLGGFFGHVAPAALLIPERNSCFTAAIAVTYLTLPTVTTMVFGMFSCDSFDDGTKLLRTDYSIDCNGADRGFWLAYSYLMVLIFPVGVTLMYFVLLFVNRKEINCGDGDVRARELNQHLMGISFLFEPYKPQFWFYEVVETARRLLMTGVLSTIQPGTMTQLSAGLIGSVAGTLCVGVMQPYLEYGDNAIAVLTGCQLIVVFMSASFLKHQRDTVTLNDYDDRGMGTIMIFSYVVVMVLFFLWALYVKDDLGKSSSSIAVSALKRGSTAKVGGKKGRVTLKKKGEGEGEDKGQGDIEMMGVGEGGEGIGESGVFVADNPMWGGGGNGGKAKVNVNVSDDGLLKVNNNDSEI